MDGEAYIKAVVILVWISLSLTYAMVGTLTLNWKWARIGVSSLVIGTIILCGIDLLLQTMGYN